MGWQRCVVVRFERDVLSSVPATSAAEVALDLKALFKVGREKRARALAGGFVELYGKRFPKAVAMLEAGISAMPWPTREATTQGYCARRNMLERLFEEVKRRARAVGVFPNETSASVLATGR